MLSFFPRDVLDEILNLNESVSEGFPSYSLTVLCLVDLLTHQLDEFTDHFSGVWFMESLSFRHNCCKVYTVNVLIRRRILWRLILVFTVW